MNLKTAKIVIGVLTGVNLVSIPLTGYLSARATYKSHKILSDTELTKGEKFKKCWKNYIPTAIVATGGMGACIGAAVNNGAVRTTLGTALLGLEEVHRNQTKKLTDAVKEGKVQLAPEFEDPEADCWFWDSWSGRSFMSRMDTVERRIQEFQDAISENWDGSAMTGNDYFSYLGLSDAAVGEDYIWDFSGMMARYGTWDPGISIIPTDVKGSYIIDMKIQPQLCCDF